jgi:integrase
MPGHVYKRGQIYWIKFAHKGKRYHTSSKSARKSDAERLLSVYLGEIAAGTFKGFKTDVATLPVGELLDDFIRDCEDRGLRNMNRTVSHLRPVKQYFGRMDAASVTVRNIDRYKKKRREDGLSVATINRELALLGQAFRMAQKKELIERVPLIEKYRENNARQGFFERADFESVVSHLPLYLQDIVRFGYYSGWRKGEILKLEWRDVQEGVIRLRPEASKTKESRVLVLVGEIAEVIERRRAARFELSPYVFHRDGKRIRDFRKAWRRACRLAGVEGRIFHDFRRTAVRNMVRAGVPEKIAMSISGHKTRAIFDRYNIINEQDIREGMLKTQEYLKSGDNLVTLRERGQR